MPFDTLFGERKLGLGEVSFRLAAAESHPIARRLDGISIALPPFAFTPEIDDVAHSSRAALQGFLRNASMETTLAAG